MCAVVLTHNPVRSLKQRLQTGILGIAIVSCVLTLINIVDLSLIIQSDDYGFYYYDFFYSFGSIIVLGVISFVTYIILLGCYLVFGTSLLKVSDLTFPDSEKAKLAGILLILGTCFEAVGYGTNLLSIFTVIGVGQYILLVATLFYILSYYFLFRVFKGLSSEGITSKKMTPTVIIAPIFLLIRAITMIAVPYSTDYFAYLITNSALSIVAFAVLAVGMFLVYNANDSIDVNKALAYVKPSGTPVYQPFTQPAHQEPAKQQVADYQPAKTTFCSNCGTKVSSNDTFCSSCGKTLG